MKFLQLLNFQRRISRFLGFEWRNHSIESVSVVSSYIRYDLMLYVGTFSRCNCKVNCALRKNLDLISKYITVEN